MCEPSALPTPEDAANDAPSMAEEIRDASSAVLVAGWAMVLGVERIRCRRSRGHVHPNIFYLHRRRVSNVESLRRPRVDAVLAAGWLFLETEAIVTRRCRPEADGTATNILVERKGIDYNAGVELISSRHGGAA